MAVGEALAPRVGFDGGRDKHIFNDLQIRNADRKACAESSGIATRASKFCIGQHKVGREQNRGALDGARMVGETAAIS